MTPRPHTLLVVDADAANRDWMTRLLSGEGFHVSAVENGKSALQWIKDNPADLILLEIDAPGDNGLKALRDLRKKYDPVQLPIIALTAETGNGHAVDALNCGASDTIARPVDSAIVLARIRTQLALKRAEEALRESEERYALAAVGSNDGLWDWHFRTSRVYFSPRWKSMLGYDADEIGEKPEEWFRRIHPDDVNRVHADITAHLGQLTPHYEGEYRIQHKDGNYLWMLGRGIAVRNSRGRAYRMAGSQTDITRGKVVDVLTGLPNRVLFMDRLGRSFALAKRSHFKSFALIFLDLDSFKLINDSLGHLIGDQMLVTIAGRLEATVRSCDSISRLGRNHTVARLGGDEFTILLDDISSTQDAIRIAERISAELSKPFKINSQDLFPTASIGIAVYNPAYTTPEEILRDADTAMYSAKALGKGRYEIFDSDMRANAVARLQLENELRRGMEKQEFEIYYQPVVALRTRKITGFEALIRWNHCARGVIPPGEFIPVAEETGLIVALGQWVFETACQQARIWQTRFGATQLSININISARHFLQSNLVEYCRNVLHETQLSESSLVLEVTESAMMPDPDTAIEVMRRLKSFGIKLAMDDFGTGYSSLSYLHRFPLDCLKIDKSFISRMMEDDEIVRTIITLGRNLGLQVIAEGVETESQIERLMQLGCSYAQGYIFSIPVHASEATDLLMAEQFHPPTLADAAFGEYSLMTE
ncbi:MAG: EAL domain-containing protein [Acidobacteria bacterium]|nr:EAL domain-containing protein [Acidobacteriota bacterium]